MHETVVLMVGIPTMLEEIIANAIRERPGVRISEDDASHESVEADVVRIGPDVVLMGLRNGATLDTYAPLLYQHPRVRLIGVSHEGRNVQAVELAPQHTDIGNVSPTELADVICTPSLADTLGSGAPPEGAH